MFEQLDAEDQNDNAPKTTDWSGVIIAIAIAPVYLFFSSMGQYDKALSASICLGMALLAIRLYWKKLRTHSWFWGIVLVLIALHVPLIIKVQWPHGWISGVALLPIGLADLFIYIGAITLAEKFIGKSPPPDGEA